VRQLELLNSNLVQAQQENERLHRLLNFSASVPFKTMGARVIGRAPNFLSNIIYLDRGSVDGVQANQAVVSESGVIGRTILVALKSCQVQLLSNGDASVGVIIERTRVPGVLRGSENPVLELKYVSNTDDVEVGDVLITSGLDGIYPKGLPVGKVVDSQKGKTGFRDLRVAPSADLIRIEEVLILSGTPRPIAAPTTPDTIK
jgi:rod shape-determining protein MreC